MEELRSALQNALFALEYWERESRICGGEMPWIDAPYERGLSEIHRARIALSKLSPLVQGGR